jgi:methionyl-tRNA formyltransferase|tara:strand:+ start:41585 stop:42364 length:780 start_codon:yes stop_codon:yes gene_type:complete
MKIVIFTSNAMRHKFVANTLAPHADEVLVISESKSKNSPGATDVDKSPRMIEHFRLRSESEKKFFGGHDTFKAKSVLVEASGVNSPHIYELVKNFNPDVAFVFGSGFIKEPLLSLIPEGRFINLHLGLSPYYRGSGTNFWPFVNNELEYVGATILHLDSGIDTGDIIAHVRPKIEHGDTVHIVGNKTIQSAAEILVTIIQMLKKGEEIPRLKQWKVSSEHVYKRKDFDDEALDQYYDNLEDGLFDVYASHPKEIKLISL